MAKLETRRADMEALTGRQGEVLGRSRPYSIQQLEEDAFAALIGDWDPMHNEPAWKFDAGWGGTIVLGFHVLSRAERFLRECGVPARSDEEGTFMTLGIGRARFMSPFPVGAEATCGVRLDSVEAGRWGQAMSRRWSMSASARSFFRLWFSICRIRSRVTLNVRPTSSSVCGCRPSSP